MSGPTVVEAYTHDVSSREYDVVVVGAGVVGALVAKKLSDAGRTVLVLEAGTGRAATFSGYRDDLTQFYRSLTKDPEAPYPLSPDAPQPSVLDVAKPPTSAGYFVQQGPLPFASTYDRTYGGTTLHWLGTCLRMLPEDFELHSRFGQTSDWPIGYADLEGYYGAAERLLGVAADVEDQEYLGIRFPAGYVYPMHKIPQSYVDATLTRRLGTMTVNLGGEERPVVVTSTPQARNGMPNPRFDGGGYQPVGAPGGYGLGERCAGNTNCVPICPIQAKYNATKTWDTVRDDLVTVAVQAVASRLDINADGRIDGVVYQAYADPGSPEHVTRTARGRAYVLAAHSVENAKLLLASGACPTSDAVGRNLMDHPVLLMWGLMPEPVWSGRGPLSTSGIETMRGGGFRREFAAFRVEIGNEGWLWPTGGLPALAGQAIDDGMFGRRLREHVAEVGRRQFRIGFLVEQLPESANRVTIDDRYRDPLGNYRPVVHYDISDYTRAGIAAAHRVGAEIFARAGIEDHTIYNTTDPTYFTYDGIGYSYQGAGHLAGTHRMGTDRRTSVVDADQRAWDHQNLFLTGCGSFTTLGTSNPTLTASALALRCADRVLADLGGR